jgi:hypothetical protein
MMADTVEEGLFRVTIEILAPFISPRWPISEDRLSCSSKARTRLSIPELRPDRPARGVDRLVVQAESGLTGGVRRDFGRADV